MIDRHFKLEAAQDEKLIRLKHRYRITWSAIVRMAIDQFKMPKPLKEESVEADKK